MADANNTETKHVLTKEEKRQLSKSRADKADVEDAAKEVMSKHRNAIRELANR